MAMDIEALKHALNELHMDVEAWAPPVSPTKMSRDIGVLKGEMRELQVQHDRMIDVVEQLAMSDDDAYVRSFPPREKT
jgi:Zn-dependent M32 family carboxypeptidase